MSTEEVKKGLDVLKKLGTLEVVLSGGNPLLRDDIEEIIGYASERFLTTVYDNGSMALKKVDAVRKADFVAVSIDSLDAAKHDSLRGVSGAWEHAVKTVERLQDEGVPVSVSPTISQFNLDEILGLSEYFLERGVPVWYCLYSFDSGGDMNQLFRIGKENDEFIIADKERMVRLCDSLLELRRRNSDVLVTRKILEAVRDFYACGKRSWRCRALRNFFVIDHLGRVAGCHLHEPVASILDLPEKWNSEEFEELRRSYAKCERCTYMCYIFYSLHGSITGNLELARDRWRSAGLLFKKHRTILRE